MFTGCSEYDQLQCVGPVDVVTGCSQWVEDIPHNEISTFLESVFWQPHVANEKL